ncbi:hydrogenase maturation protease [Psychromonas sp.]|uniref:hydrogenase maturation protease n=1 Tax=Psychromonas sp. TaxID=1884585 RepID=UPI0035637BC9
MKKASQQALDLFIWGNPSRGDDAIGPTLHHIMEQYIERLALTHVQLIEDMQLQPEHVCDIREGACIVFIDASFQGDAACQVQAVNPEEQFGCCSHALSPDALMRLYQQIHNKPCPPAFLLSVRGYQFALGSPLSKAARANIKVAEQFLKTLLTCQYPQQLLQQAVNTQEGRSNA